MASAKKIIEIIEKLKGNKLTALEHYQRDPFVVLISTILSQRTRDENTIRATNKLFSVYKTPEEIAKAPLEKLEEIIKEVGFYKVKAKRIKEVSRIIAEKYNNSVPDNIKELLKLPGVGRKTANCVLVYGYNKHAIPVDTHVHRISNRLGLVKTKSPEETEKELTKIIPKEYWRELNSLFVKFGQIICKPINPRCNECPLADICPSKK
ncbi:MAG: endonuclease III [Candidatus Hydrothermarchaeota archaeon]|nr:MAG: endonuclease III [Candidatus Hydrothermarchaeota archaeon]